MIRARTRWGAAHTIAMAVLFTALVLVAAAVLWVRSAEADRSGSERLAGLGSDVAVLWDSLAVPHVWAGSVEDLLFTQGYLHARDRLFQMDVVRRAAEGRLAEVLGEAALPADRFLRTLDLWSVTAEEERRLDPGLRRYLDAYVAGVNAWIGNRKGALPPEFLVLRYEPEPWTVRHTLGVVKVMAQDLTLYSTTASIARAAQRLGQDRARWLVPEYPAWGATILGGAQPPEAPALAAGLLNAVGIAAASNAWVLAPSRTRTGRPILANDPHLGLQAPSIWYLMALHGGGLDVTGTTLPGAPLVILGRNRAVAWGFTNASLDDADLFLERLDPADSTRYLTPDGSRPFRFVVDTIRVKGRDQPEILRRWITRHGPVMSGIEGWRDSIIALQWTSHSPATTFEAILRLNRAAGWTDFEEAVRRFGDPHQNVIYADTAGHIGYIMGGTVPIRGDGRPPPTLPVPGWTGEWDWTGTLPFEEHPRALDPPDGYVVTANNRQTAGPVADLISAIWRPPFRAMRIGTMIREGAPFDADGVHAMQLDVLDALAARYRDLAVGAARTAGLGAAAELLQSWDLRATPDSRAAALFYLWKARLRDALRADLYDGADGYLPTGTFHHVLEAREIPWTDDIAFADLAAGAMATAAEQAEGHRWGDIHSVAHLHPLGSVALLDDLLGLNVEADAHPGSSTTVNVAEYPSADRSSFRTTSGVSMRHVTDMANPDGGAGFILGTGQSGLPFSDHYRDQFLRWREGGLWRLPMDRAAAERRTTERMTLEPER